ncbi:replication initiation and membrane attachment family protein [Paenibacillus alkalitolerans]|uniref:helicase DnaB n=1 Tax=Paenibacillus alkalitolerans TaxID=2799335 RepID=UPI0018F67C09|nr:helicase DnaB [Paenibacillus alkalitolerans]
MKLSNLLQLTEQQPFAVVRQFSLSPLDTRMINMVYQPIVGAFAASLFYTLCSRLPTETVGRSDPVQLAVLFLACGLEPNERGRKRLVEETSKLEAAGLLRTYRRSDADGVAELYEFRVEAPLAPQQFFDVHHLWLLLIERIGPKAAEAVRRSFFHGMSDPESEASEAGWEDLSVPFYEVFRLSVPAGTEQAVREAAPSRATAADTDATEFGKDGFRPEELLRRFPRSSANRRYVERIQKEPELLAEINYYAGKFELTLKETVSLLDEEGMFTDEGRLNGEWFESRAGGMFLRVNERRKDRDRLRSKQSTAGEPDAGTSAAGEDSGGERTVTPSYWLDVPEQFAGECDAAQYNSLLANAPYTRVLKLFFEPASVPGPVQEAFLAMNVNYRLPDEVLNVMIHYIRTNDLDWNRNFLEAVGANVAGKRIRTFENAVVYFRKAAQVRGGGAPTQERSAAPSRRTGETRRGRPSKPVIPVVKRSESKAATEQDIQRILDMAKQLKDDR